MEKLKAVRNDEQRNELAERNIKLVYHFTKLFFKRRPDAKRWYSEEEAYSDAFVGLLRAAELYNENVGRFSTYAYLWVKKYLRLGLNEAKNIIRVPVHWKDHIPVARSYATEEWKAGEFSQEEYLTAKAVLERLLRKIPAREAEIIRLRSEGVHLKEIGQRMGIVYQRVQQLERRAIHVLRVIVKKEKIQL